MKPSERPDVRRAAFAKRKAEGKLRPSEMPGRGAARQRKHRYGISGEQWQQMFDAQEGTCAVCQEAIAQCVDHDHDTGKVRALLCINCNAGMGQLNDDPELLERAAAYIRQWNASGIATI